MTDYTTYCPDSVLFERNPVCGVCWRVCMDMCEEWGGPIQFDLLASMEAADRLCQRLINNTWTLRGIEYYYHWLEAQLGFSRAAITCATATVCLSLRLMDDAPEPLQQMGADMQGLLWGEGGELYDNMRCAARQQDICLTTTNYGEIPPDPNEEIKAENVELRYQVDQLSHELQTMSKQGEQFTIGTQNNYYAPVTIKNYGDKSVCDTAEDSHDSVSVVSNLFTEKAKLENRINEIIQALEQSMDGRKDKAQALVEEVKKCQKNGYIDSHFNARVMYDKLNLLISMPFQYPGFRKYYNR